MSEVEYVIAGAILGFVIFIACRVWVDPRIQALPFPYGKVRISVIVTLLSILFVYPVAGRFEEEGRKFRQGYIISASVSSAQDVIREVLRVNKY